MTKSNSIPTRWETHKLENNYITDVIPQESEFSAHIRLPSLGVQQLDEESPENLALKTSSV